MLCPTITLANFDTATVKVLRWDQNNEKASGNKFEKLLWHSAVMKAMGIQQVCSMGGPWSNALHALGATLQGTNIKGLALIRGQSPRYPSPTLQDLSAWGIPQHFISRAQYRALRADSQAFFYKAEQDHAHLTAASTVNINPHPKPENLPGFLQLCYAMPEDWQAQLVKRIKHDALLSQNFFSTLNLHLPNTQATTWWIPEGGEGTLGTWSIAAWARQLAEHLERTGQACEAWVVPVGSGTTFLGLLAGASLANTSTPKHIVGVPVYKGAENFKTQTQTFLQQWSLPCNDAGNQKLTWTLWTDHHWGGFAKYPQELATQHSRLEQRYHAPLDRVYTLKVAAALEAYVSGHSSHLIPPLGPDIQWLFFHTGGLQGNRTQKMSS